MAQPTWVLMQMVQCSRSSRSSTHSIRSAVGQFQQQLFRAVVGLAAGGDPGGPDLKLGGQLLADRLGQVGHLRRRRRRGAGIASAAPGRPDSRPAPARRTTLAVSGRVVRGGEASERLWTRGHGPGTRAGGVYRGLFAMCHGCVRWVAVWTKSHRDSRRKGGTSLRSSHPTGALATETHYTRTALCGS